MIDVNKVSNEFQRMEYEIGEIQKEMGYLRYEMRLDSIARYLTDCLRKTISKDYIVYAMISMELFVYSIKVVNKRWNFTIKFNETDLNEKTDSEIIKIVLEEINKKNTSQKLEDFSPKNLYLRRCECCNAILKSDTCEYCGAKYFYG